MRFYLVIFMLLASGARLAGQATPAAAATLPSGTAQTKPAENPPPFLPSTEASVRPEDAVITLHGVCSTPLETTLQKDGSCQTLVSRRQFEFLSNAINLGGKPISLGARQDLAKTYAEYLVYEQPAKKAGLENSERYAEIMRWLRLRILTDLLREQIAEEYRTPSDAEVVRYYQENVSEFERVHVSRILIPRNVHLAGEEREGEKDEGKQKEERDNKLLAVAKTAHERALKGDDPEQIQKDAYVTLGIGAPPPTDLGEQGRRDFLDEESAELFALKPGDVSKVESEPVSYVIYKVIDRETLPESAVKEQISREISRQNIDKANHAITQSVQAEYNEKYFGPPVPEAPLAGTPGHP